MGSHLSITKIKTTKLMNQDAQLCNIGAFVQELHALKLFGSRTNEYPKLPRF